ncbi:MAG: O-antigen ligase family protein [Candidatus Acidiferrum sp.]
MFLIYLIIFISAVPKHPWLGEEVGGFTLAKYLGVVCFLYALLALSFRATLPVLFTTWPARLFVALTAWGIASCFFVSHAPEPLVLAQPFISYFAIFFAIVTCVNSLRRLQFAVLSLLGALDLASLYFLREYQKIGFGAARASGWVVGDGNYFACAALLTIPIAYYLIPSTREQLLKWFYRTSLALTFLAVVFSASRGAFAGLCGVVAVTLFSSGNKYRALFASALIVVALLVSPVSPIKRILDPEYGDNNSTEAHEGLWKFGVRMALEHPLFGIGVGNFKSYTVVYHVTDNPTGFEGHNAYIHLAAETGFVGFLFYLGVNLSAILLLRQIQKAAVSMKHAYLYSLSVGMQQGIIGFAVGAFFISAQSEKPFWIVISMVAALVPIAETQWIRWKAQRQAHTPESASPEQPQSEPDLVPSFAR